MEIIVIAEFIFKQNSIIKAKTIVAEILVPSRQEKGCLYYDFFQDGEHTNQFIMLERWANKAAWEAHLNAKHIAKAAGAIKGYLAEPIKMRWFIPTLLP